MWKPPEFPGHFKQDQVKTQYLTGPHQIGVLSTSSWFQSFIWFFPSVCAHVGSILRRKLDIFSCCVGSWMRHIERSNLVLSLGNTGNSLLPKMAKLCPRSCQICHFWEKVFKQVWKVNLARKVLSWWVVPAKSFWKSSDRWRICNNQPSVGVSANNRHSPL